MWIIYLHYYYFSHWMSKMLLLCNKTCEMQWIVMDFCARCQTDWTHSWWACLWYYTILLWGGGKTGPTVCLNPSISALHIPISAGQSMATTGGGRGEDELLWAMLLSQGWWEWLRSPPRCHAVVRFRLTCLSLVCHLPDFNVISLPKTKNEYLEANVAFHYLLHLWWTVRKIILLINSSGERICELHLEHIKMTEISNVGVGNDPSGQRSSLLRPC